MLRPPPLEPNIVVDIEVPNIENTPLQDQHQVVCVLVAVD